MVLPEDNKTISLSLESVTEKRGRGRPRKEGSLSNAERQAAFRARRREAVVTATVIVTKNIPAPVDAYDDLVQECERLRDELAKTRSELCEASTAGAARGSAWSFAGVLQREVPAQGIGQDEYRLGFKIVGSLNFALERLAVRFGLTKRVVTERLIYWADEALLRQVRDDDAEFNRYVDRIRNEN